MQNVSTLKGENVRFLNCRENHVDGDYTRTKKLKLQYKVVAKVPFRRIQFVLKRAIHSAENFFLHFFFAFFFSVTLPCMNFFFAFSPLPPSHISNGLSLNTLVIS